MSSTVQRLSTNLIRRILYVYKNMKKLPAKHCVSIRNNIIYEKKILTGGLDGRKTSVAHAIWYAMPCGQYVRVTK